MVSNSPAVSHSSRDDEALVEWVAARYDRCHPGDSFRDLVQRSFFSKEDRRLMEDWLAAGRAAARHPRYPAPAGGAEKSHPPDIDRP